MKDGIILIGIKEVGRLSRELAPRGRFEKMSFLFIVLFFGIFSTLYEDDA